MKRNPERINHLQEVCVSYTYFNNLLHLVDLIEQGEKTVDDFVNSDYYEDICFIFDLD